jgi:hypothetical protein
LMCAYIPSTFLCCMAMTVQEPMMKFITLLLPLHEMLTFTCDENNYMHFP